MLPNLLLPLGGGILVYFAQSRRSQPRLVDVLATLPVAGSANQPDSSKSLTTLEQNLALSCTLLGVTTIGNGVIPFGHLLSTGGLLYLDIYFISNAYRRWREERRITVATNDAVVATGLLLTGQFAADSLFATLFFASDKLQKQSEKELASYLATIQQGGETEQSTDSLLAQPQGESASVTVTPSKAPWHDQIDQSALPLLALSAISTPWLGIHRALAVLLTNFSYDYRLTAPLSTLHYLKAANDQGIRLRDPHLLDRLQEIDTLVVDIAEENLWLQALQSDCPYQILSLRSVTSNIDREKKLAELRKEGRRLAWMYDQVAPPSQIDSAELSIAIYDATVGTRQPNADITLTNAQPAQLQQLLALVRSLAASRQRGFYLALIPGLINLGGIYLGRLNVVGALLIDYGAAVAGVVNTMLPIPSPLTDRDDT